MPKTEETRGTWATDGSLIGVGAGVGATVGVLIADGPGIAVGCGAGAFVGAIATVVARRRSRRRPT